MIDVKKILFISGLYPNPLLPNMATFNRQQIKALNEYCKVEVIAPIPWTVLLKKQVKLKERVDGAITVHHPTYYYTPYVMRYFYKEFFYSSIKKIALSLLDNKKFDIIYSSWLYPDSWAAAKLAKRYNLPLFVKVHGSDVNRLISGTSICRSSLEIASQAEKVICVSRALKERLIMLGVPASKLEVLYNGVDLALFFPMDWVAMRRRLKVEHNEFFVLYVGNLKKEKGIYELISSFKTASEAINKPSRLVIIGSGPYSTAAKELVSSLLLSEKVEFLGSQPLKTIALWMNAASLLCLPSYMEGVPNVILEALACGTKVIATEVGGIPELDTGASRMILLPPKSIDPLVAAFKICSKQNEKIAPPSFLCSWSENAKQLCHIMSCE